MADLVDMGWSIICPDGCIRNKPYINEGDAEFDSLYISSRGCFDYDKKEIIEYNNPCPQGDHTVSMSLFDMGLGLVGSCRGPCDVLNCVRTSKWRTGLSVISSDTDVEVHCNIALKTCNLHKKSITPWDIINEKEWGLIAEQFANRGVIVPSIKHAKLTFVPLATK